MARLLLTSSTRGLQLQTRYSCVCSMVIILAAAALLNINAVQAGKPTANFIFGDSLVDAGNNNHLASLDRADYAPYGIDMSGHQPTGRFSNGRILPDLMSESMGIDYQLPVLDPAATGPKILQGLNYASAGAGILNESGAVYLSRLTLPQQFQCFQQTKAQIAAQIGQEAADQLIEDAIYSFTFGTSDYFSDYMNPLSTTSQQYTPPQFQDLLISTYYGHLQTAYSLGMRKFTVSNVLPLGCAPIELAFHAIQNGSCISSIQDMITGFNDALKPMSEQLQAELPGSVFVYFDIFSVLTNVINNPASYGFTVTDTACCGVLNCFPLEGYCNNRDEYVFWDPSHPSERMNIVTQQHFMEGGLDVVSPMNVGQLLNL